VTEKSTPLPLLAHQFPPKPACALQFVCYNADTSRNNLSYKGLHVIRNRFLSAFQLICLLVAGSAVGLAADATAAVRKSTTHRSSSAPRKLTLKKPAAASQATTRRRTRAGHTNAAVQAAALREAIEPRFKLDDAGSVVPDIRAEAAIIYNPVNGKVLWESNSTSSWGRVR